MFIDDIRPTTAPERAYTVADPNIAERVICDLAVLFHARARRANPSLGSVIPWDVQLIAHSFFDQFGLEECLTELAKG
jgi:hypothetical protein